MENCAKQTWTNTTSIVALTDAICEYCREGYSPYTLSGITAICVADKYLTTYITNFNTLKVEGCVKYDTAGKCL